LKTLKLFWKSKCPNCPNAKKVVEQLTKKVQDKNHLLKIIEYDVESVDGLAEASFYEIVSTPSIIIVDEKDNEIASFRGKVPTIAELENVLVNK